MNSPSDLLKAIGRSIDSKLTVESWEELWQFDRIKLKQAGLPVRDRRYVHCIWQLLSGSSMCHNSKGICYGLWRNSGKERNPRCSHILQRPRKLFGGMFPLGSCLILFNDEHTDEGLQFKVEKGFVLADDARLYSFLIHIMHFFNLFEERRISMQPQTVVMCTF